MKKAISARISTKSKISSNNVPIKTEASGGEVSRSNILSEKHFYGFLTPNQC